MRSSYRIDGELLQDLAHLHEQRSSLVGRRSQLGETWRGHAVGVANELHHDHCAEQLHRVWNGSVGLPQARQDGELGGCPLSGNQFSAELGSRFHGAVLAASPHSSTFEVARIAMEHSVLRIAVPLGRQQYVVVSVRPANQRNVGLLSGLENAQVGVDRRGRRDDPVRRWSGTMRCIGVCGIGDVVGVLVGDVFVLTR